jgi:hypothetical protein
MNLKKDPNPGLSNYAFSTKPKNLSIVFTTVPFKPSYLYLRPKPTNASSKSRSISSSEGLLVLAVESVPFMASSRLVMADGCAESVEEEELLLGIPRST